MLYQIASDWKFYVTHRHLEILMSDHLYNYQELELERVGNC